MKFSTESRLNQELSEVWCLLRKEKAATERYRSGLQLAVGFLEALANQLDDWARESREGRWSTHQVADNIRVANDCRRKAAELKVVL